MKTISATSNFVVCKLIALSLLCVGVGGCAADADSAAPEESAATVDVATEELVTQTLIQLHGSEPSTVVVRTVTRAQQNAELAEREQWLKTPEASNAALREGEERLGASQDALTINSSCGTSSIWMSDAANFNGLNSLCVSGTGAINLQRVCVATGQFANPGCPGSGTSWWGFVKSYSANNNTGFFGGNCSYYDWIIAGSGLGCAQFAVNSVHSTVSSCEGSARVLGLGTLAYVCHDATPN